MNSSHMAFLWSEGFRLESKGAYLPGVKVLGTPSPSAKSGTLPEQTNPEAGRGLASDTEPVTLRVLPVPQTAEVLAQDPKRLAQLGTPMTEAIATVRRTLDDYRRAKGPIETSWRNNLRLSKDDHEVQLRNEVQLRTRPDGFDEVIVQAEA
jgi:hypothetical protein